MIGPDQRLIAAAAVGTAAAMLLVPLSALWSVAAAGLLGLLALLVWDLALLRRLPPLGVERRLPPRTFVGRATAIELVLHNRGDTPVECAVSEELPADVAPSALDLRWTRVAPRATAALRYAIRPTRRGDRKLGTAVVLARSPLGFWRRRLLAGGGDVLRVYPDASRFLRPEALDPRRVLAVLGGRPARRRGEGMEFESLRDYLPGDDPRRVDWRATVRRGRVAVRQYRHERHHTVVVAVDASRLMAGEVDGRTKLDYAVDAALALAYTALATGDRVGLVAFDREVVAHLPPRAHRRSLGAFLEALRTLDPRLVEADPHTLLRWLSAHHRQRALVVVFTDFVEADPTAFSAPLALLARRHRLLLVAVRDRLYRLLDAADGGRDDGLDLYRRVVLDDLLRQRETTLGALRRCGVQTADLLPESVTGAVLNRYLALRYGPDR